MPHWIPDAIIAIQTLFILYMMYITKVKENGLSELHSTSSLQSRSITELWDVVNKTKKDLFESRQHIHSLHTKLERTVAELREHRSKTSLTPSPIEQLDTEPDTASPYLTNMDKYLRESAIDAPAQSAPQLYYFKPVGESSEDDVFNDADGDRIYITESKLITIDRTERTNETYLAKYTGPDPAPRELKYKWVDGSPDVYTTPMAFMEEDRDVSVRQSADDSWYYSHAGIGTGFMYPTKLDAQLEMEHYYDNYIKKS